MRLFNNQCLENGIFRALIENEDEINVSERTFYVSKKGMGFYEEDETNSLSYAQNMGVSWYYNWSEEAYDDQDVIQERHRHRYEFNNKYREAMAAKGMVFSGTSPDNRLVEVIELPKKRFFVASQYHPEFLSRPNRPEGLFKAFIDAANQTGKVKA